MNLRPDFVIELASDSEELAALRRKMNEYRANRCRLGWLILPQQQQVEIYRPDCEPVGQDFSSPLSGQDVLPGFSLLLSALY